MPRYPLDRLPFSKMEFVQAMLGRALEELTRLTDPEETARCRSGMYDALNELCRYGEPTRPFTEEEMERWVGWCTDKGSLTPYSAEALLAALNSHQTATKGVSAPEKAREPGAEHVASEQALLLAEAVLTEAAKKTPTRLTPVQVWVTELAEAAATAFVSEGRVLTSEEVAAVRDEAPEIARRAAEGGARRNFQWEEIAGKHPVTEKPQAANWDDPRRAEVVRSALGYLRTGGQNEERAEFTDRILRALAVAPIVEPGAFPGEYVVLLTGALRTAGPARWVHLHRATLEGWRLREGIDPAAAARDIRFGYAKQALTEAFHALEPGATPEGAKTAFWKTFVAFQSMRQAPRASEAFLREWWGRMVEQAHEEPEFLALMAFNVPEGVWYQECLARAEFYAELKRAEKATAGAAAETFRTQLAAVALQDPEWSGAENVSLKGPLVKNGQALLTLAAAFRQGMEPQEFSEELSPKTLARLTEGLRAVAEKGLPAAGAFTRMRVKALNPRGHLYRAALNPSYEGRRLDLEAVKALEREWRDYCRNYQDDRDRAALQGWGVRWAEVAVGSTDADARTAARAYGLVALTVAEGPHDAHQRAAAVRVSAEFPVISGGGVQNFFLYKRALDRLEVAAGHGAGTISGALLVELAREANYAGRRVPREERNGLPEPWVIEHAAKRIIPEQAKNPKRAATAVALLRNPGWQEAALEAARDLSQNSLDSRVNLARWNDSIHRCADMAWGAWVRASAEQFGNEQHEEARPWLLCYEAVTEAQGAPTVAALKAGLVAAASLFRGPLGPGYTARHGGDPQPAVIEAKKALQAFFEAAPTAYRNHTAYLEREIEKWARGWEPAEADEVRALHAAQYPQKTGPAVEVDPKPLEITVTVNANGDSFPAAGAEGSPTAVEHKDKAAPVRTVTLKNFQKEFENFCIRYGGWERGARIEKLEQWAGDWALISREATRLADRCIGRALELLCRTAIYSETEGSFEGARDVLAKERGIRAVFFGRISPSDAYRAHLQVLWSLAHTRTAQNALYLDDYFDRVSTEAIFRGAPLTTKELGDLISPKALSALLRSHRTIRGARPEDFTALISIAVEGGWRRSVGSLLSAVYRLEGVPQAADLLRQRALTAVWAGLERLKAEDPHGQETQLWELYHLSLSEAQGDPGAFEALARLYGEFSAPPTPKSRLEALRKWAEAVPRVFTYNAEKIARALGADDSIKAGVEELRNKAARHLTATADRSDPSSLSAQFTETLDRGYQAENPQAQAPDWVRGTLAYWETMWCRVAEETGNTLIRHRARALEDLCAGARALEASGRPDEARYLLGLAPSVIQRFTTADPSYSDRDAYGQYLGLLAELQQPPHVVGEEVKTVWCAAYFDRLAWKVVELGRGLTRGSGLGGYPLPRTVERAIEVTRDPARRGLGAAMLNLLTENWQMTASHRIYAYGQEPDRALLTLKAAELIAESERSNPTRWHAYRVGYEEVVASEPEGRAARLSRFVSLFRGACGPGIPGTADWERFDLDLATWARLAPESFLGAVDVFLERVEKAPEELRGKITAAIRNTVHMLKVRGYEAEPAKEAASVDLTADSLYRELDQLSSEYETLPPAERRERLSANQLRWLRFASSANGAVYGWAAAMGELAVAALNAEHRTSDPAVVVRLLGERVAVDRTLSPTNARDDEKGYRQHLKLLQYLAGVNWGPAWVEAKRFSEGLVRRANAIGARAQEVSTKAAADLRPYVEPALLDHAVEMAFVLGRDPWDARALARMAQAADWRSKTRELLGLVAGDPVIIHQAKADVWAACDLSSYEARREGGAELQRRARRWRAYWAAWVEVTAPGAEHTAERVSTLARLYDTPFGPEAPPLTGLSDEEHEAYRVALLQFYRVAPNAAKTFVDVFHEEAEGAAAPGTTARLKLETLLNAILGVGPEGEVIKEPMAEEEDSATSPDKRSGSRRPLPGTEEETFETLCEGLAREVVRLTTMDEAQRRGREMPRLEADALYREAYNCLMDADTEETWTNWTGLRRWVRGQLAHDQDRHLALSRCATTLRSEGFLDLDDLAKIVSLAEGTTAGEEIDAYLRREAARIKGQGEKGVRNLWYVEREHTETPSRAAGVPRLLRKEGPQEILELVEMKRGGGESVDGVSSEAEVVLARMGSPTVARHLADMVKSKEISNEEAEFIVTRVKGARQSLNDIETVFLRELDPTTRQEGGGKEATHNVAVNAKRNTRMKDKIISTALSDAQDIALRSSVKQARAMAADLFTNFFLAKSTPRTAGESDETYAARVAESRRGLVAFFASDAGQGLISYALGMGWVVFEDEIGDEKVKRIGSRIAKEVRVQGGTGMVDDFVKEVVTPMAAFAKNSLASMVSLEEPAPERTRITHETPSTEDARDAEIAALKERLRTLQFSPGENSPSAPAQTAANGS